MKKKMKMEMEWTKKMMSTVVNTKWVLLEGSLALERELKEQMPIILQRRKRKRRKRRRRSHRKWRIQVLEST